MATQADASMASHAVPRVEVEVEPTWSVSAARAYESTVPVLPRQVARCLTYVSAHPGSSGVQVQLGLGMRHLSQASRLLIKLKRQGLLYTDRRRRVPNAWELTEEGRALVGQLPEGVYD